MERVDVNEDNFSAQVERAVELLASREVIALKTDTVFGLAVDAENEVAIEKVFALKGRSAEKALPVFVSSFEMLDKVAFIKDERVKELLRKVWPGAVTSILSARGWLPLSLRGGLLTVAVRIPKNEFVLAVVEKFGGPITGTSANISGKDACLGVNDVINEFKHLPLKPSAIFEDQSVSIGTASTILDCTEWPPKVVRQGAVPEEIIKSYIKE